MSDVKRQARFALALIAREDLQDAVFQFQSAKPFFHRLAIDHLQVNPSAGHGAGRGVEQPVGLLTGYGKHGRGAGFVSDLDQECSPALFHQLVFSFSLHNLDAAFGIDLHSHKAMGVENFLKTLDGASGAQLGGFGGRQRLTQHF